MLNKGATPHFGSSVRSAHGPQSVYGLIRHFQFLNCRPLEQSGPVQIRSGSGSPQLSDWTTATLLPVLELWSGTLEKSGLFFFSNYRAN